MAFPSISAVADGYKRRMFAVIDASGTYSKWRRDHHGARGAGQRGHDGYSGGGLRIQQTRNREDAAEWAKVYTHIFQLTGC